MPNWTNNTLTITGPSEDLERFKEAVKDVDDDSGEENPLSLRKLYPRPDDVEDWYHWNVEHWGTKWDIFAHASHSETELCYDFDSAWSPPTEWLKHIAVLWPTLKFVLKYDEPGIGFKGSLRISKGGANVTDHFVDTTK